MRADNLPSLITRAERERRMPPLVVIASDEPLLSQEAADALRATARSLGYSEREVLQTDARFDWSRLAQASQGLSLFAERRIVEVRLPTGKPGVAGAAALEALAQNLNENTFALVLLPWLDRRARESRWAGALERAGVMLAIDSIDRTRLPAWIGQRLARQQQRAPDEALAFIADRVEGNLLAAHQEIVKLGLLYPTGELSIEQVREAVLNVARYDVFELPSVMLAGDATRVARTLGGLRAEGEPLPLIVWAISEELRALARVKSLVQAGRPFAEAARQSGIWGARQALVGRALGRIDLDRVEKSLARVGQVDRLIKGLRAPELDSDPWLELCEIMIDVARPAPRTVASAHR